MTKRESIEKQVQEITENIILKAVLPALEAHEVDPENPVDPDVYLLSFMVHRCLELGLCSDCLLDNIIATVETFRDEQEDVTIH